MCTIAVCTCTLGSISSYLAVEAVSDLIKFCGFWEDLLVECGSPNHALLSTS